MTENGLTKPVMQLGSVSLFATGAIVDGQIPIEEWLSAVETVKRAESGALWWIGDLLNYGEQRYGEMYSQAIDETDYDYGALRNAKWVSSQFDLSRRHDNLSWSHHMEVAAFPQEKQDELLALAAEESLSTRQLRLECQRTKAVSAHQPIESASGFITDLEEAKGTFGTIYADPPWQYGNQGTRAATDNHYDTLSVDELCDLPVKDLLAEDSHLHLWTTNGFLFHAKRVMEAWGFEYKSCFVWVKPQMGIGNYWRVSHEFMLFGIRGRAKFRDRSLMSWGQFARRKHSAKPDEIRGMVERASPGPYLEMFGRRPVDGWLVYGNEILPDEPVQKSKSD